MTPEDIQNQIAAYERSIKTKIAELTALQEAGVKFQHQQGLKDEIHRRKRELQKLKDRK